MFFLCSLYRYPTSIHCSLCIILKDYSYRYYESVEAIHFPTKLFQLSSSKHTPIPSQTPIIKVISGPTNFHTCTEHQKLKQYVYAASAALGEKFGNVFLFIVRGLEAAWRPRKKKI